MDSSRSKKGDVIADAVSKLGIEDLSLAVMIGDREHDVLGAKQVGMDSIGVLFGYGDRDEHEKAGATYIVQSVQEILPLL